MSDGKTIRESWSAIVRTPGTRIALTVLAGQIVSILGSSLSAFALGVWIFRSTQSVTLLSFVMVSATVPGLLLSPLAGVLIDRWDRRMVMLASDGLSASATLGIAALYLAGNLQVWHLCILGAVNSISGVFQTPAFLSSMPLLVPRAHLGRISGLSQLGGALAVVVAPAVAGALVLVIGLGGILLIDLVTFVVAAGTLAIVTIPRPAPRERAVRAGATLLTTLVADAGEGFRYLAKQKGLITLLGLFSLAGFQLAFANVLFVPLVLSFATAAHLGSIVTLGGLGMLCGSLVLTARGIPRRKVRSLMIAQFLGGLLMATTGVRPSIVLVGVTVFAMACIVPIARGVDQVLWQSKVALDVQGRVFALRELLYRFSAPIAYLLAGPLADSVFEPLLAEGGPLAGSLGQLLGTGPGRGIGLIFLIAGLGTSILAIIGYLHPRIRRIERELPDVVAGPAHGPAVEASGAVEIPGEAAGASAK